MLLLHEVGHIKGSFYFHVLGLDRIVGLECFYHLELPFFYEIKSFRGLPFPVDKVPVPVVSLNELVLHPLELTNLDALEEFE